MIENYSELTLEQLLEEQRQLVLQLCSHLTLFETKEEKAVINKQLEELAKLIAIRSHE